MGTSPFVKDAAGNIVLNTAAQQYGSPATETVLTPAAIAGTPAALKPHPVTTITKPTPSLPSVSTPVTNFPTSLPTVTSPPVSTPPAVVPTPTATSLPSPGSVGSVPSTPAPIQASSPANNASSPPGVVTTGPTTTPVTPAAVTQPSSSASPTTTSPTDNALLQQVLNSLSGGSNQYSAGSGGGVGADDTSLPSPTTADVEALQPTAVDTSSSGPNIGLIIGILLVAALGVYLWYRYKKGHAS